MRELCKALLALFARAKPWPFRNAKRSAPVQQTAPEGGGVSVTTRSSFQSADKKRANSNSLTSRPERRSSVTCHYARSYWRSWQSAEKPASMNSCSAVHRPAGQTLARVGDGSGNRGGNLDEADTNPRERARGRLYGKPLHDFSVMRSAGSLREPHRIRFTLLNTVRP